MFDYRGQGPGQMQADELHEETPCGADAGS
jgi:hypothetical protein